MVERKGLSVLFFDILNHAILILLAVLCIVPLVHLWAVSFSDRAAATGGFVAFWPVRFTTLSYQKVLAAGAFFSSFIVTVERTVIGTLLSMMVTILTAYPLSKSNRDFPGRDMVMIVLIFALLFSGGLIPWFLVIRSLGMLNSVWALIIPPALQIWNVILMMNFFRMVPRELEDAAMIDGASHWRVLLNVYLPISIPSLATLTLFAAVGHWNAWFDGMILMMDRTKVPLQTFLRSVVIVGDMSSLLVDPEEYAKFSNRSLQAAQILVTVVPILVLYPFLQRYFVTGITLGAVKG